jgi:hypothetical protein
MRHLGINLKKTKLHKHTNNGKDSKAKQRMKTFLTIPISLGLGGAPPGNKLSLYQLCTFTPIHAMSTKES